MLAGAWVAPDFDHHGATEALVGRDKSHEADLGWMEYHGLLLVKCGPLREEAGWAQPRMAQLGSPDPPDEWEKEGSSLGWWRAN
ncbi:unnamed protein product [Linum tenue]|uniref:Uncharacterized protein n=1 Tax=Linum tenue TaxID=586396 RepID=A0AAV0IFQ4_9ROSI|nr:unnamed protein product [Linum tenue]